MSKATFALKGRNPDILTCIANLSSDEVFTPPSFANQMLDTLEKAWAESNDGEVIWQNSSVKFLDPFTKSGVFLREIVSRLTDGLEAEFPVLQERVNHILTNQVYGIGITELTSLLARRSVYCSKYANGKHSISDAFDDEQGNIWFEPTQHTWVGGAAKTKIDPHTKAEYVLKVGRKCKFCGASEGQYSRDSDLESHAYAFIHVENISAFITKIFGENMHFDVIIGNPPYQLGDGGYAASAAPIFHHFVEQAKKLDPRFLTLVIPARWFAGGKGLDSFRAAMLSDRRLREIHDFPNSQEVFPGPQVKGGVCYFLWDRDNLGDARISTYEKNEIKSSVTRPLLEKNAKVFIRFNQALPIIKKVMHFENATSSLSDVSFSLPDSKRFSSKVSARKPFGLDTSYKGIAEPKVGHLLLHQNGGVGYINPIEITNGKDLIPRWKIFISYAYGAGESYPHQILSKPILGKPGEVSTETYLVIGPFNSASEAKNAISYITTRFFRFLVLLHKPSQHATKTVYTFVPNQDFSKPWTDEELYAKYGLADEEIEFIESMIRPMEIGNA